MKSEANLLSRAYFQGCERWISVSSPEIETTSHKACGTLFGLPNLQPFQVIIMKWYELSVLMVVDWCVLLSTVFFGFSMVTLITPRDVLCRSDNCMVHQFWSSQWISHWANPVDMDFHRGHRVPYACWAVCCLGFRPWTRRGALISWVSIGCHLQRTIEQPFMSCHLPLF